MLHLIKIEWLKLNRYKAFIILMILFVVSVIGINYIVHEVTGTSQPNNPLSMLVGKPFAFPNVWHTVSYVSSFLLFIPGLIIILIVSNEYSFRTHRQNIIDGLSRGRFIRAKIMLVFIFSFIIALIVALTAMGFGWTTQGSVFSPVHFKYIPYLFLQSTMYLSVALLLVLLFKRSGLSIGVFFMYIFILENVLGALLNRYISPYGSQFLPLDSADTLIPVPLFFNVMSETRLDDPTLIAISSIWIALILGFCYYRFSKKDL